MKEVQSYIGHLNESITSMYVKLDQNKVLEKIKDVALGKREKVIPKEEAK
jgi:hypothetical protein